MTRIIMKLTIVFVMVLSNAELKLFEKELFSQALADYLFPKDVGVTRVRTMEEVNIGKRVRILDFIGLITRHGYPAEEHNITTDDGYNLKIHRIPDSPISNNKVNKKVIFIQHGVIASSDLWVLRGPGKDLAFLLADHGYDVWLGNIRGNVYSRSHVKMSPRNADFWQFSFHESGMIDVPNMIDYVLNYTKKKNLYYIGHSMGTTMLYVLLSMRPEYNEKIKLGICLAPVAVVTNFSPAIQQIIHIWPQLKKLFNNNEVYELLPLSSTTITRRIALCSDESKFQAFCIATIFIFIGSDPIQLNTTLLREFFTYFPTSTSVLTLDHYYQNYIAKDFRTYDYGYSNNYRMSERYELEKITTPLALFYGPNDMLASKSTVLELYKRLPNIILFEEVPYKLFNHFDFILGINAKDVLYDRLINILEEFEAK